MARTKSQTHDPARKVALIYVRVSKFTKEDEGRKVSPDTQFEMCKALPALKGMTIVKFEDLDFTGTNTNRPAFQQMMERVERGDVAVVAVYKLDRLTRGGIVVLDATLKELDKAGVTLVSATESIDTSTAMGRFFLNILALMAQLESERLAERLLDTYTTQKEAGWIGGHLPVGLKRKGKGFTFDKKWSPTVLKIWKLRRTGEYSYVALARHLREQEVRSPWGWWHEAQLKAMMRNDSYRGLNKLGLPAGPALISQELWDDVQRVNKDYRRRKGEYRGVKVQHPLSGLAWCHRCGAAMHYRGATKYGGAFYRCSRSYGSAKSCDLPWIDAEILHSALRQQLGYLASPDEVDPESQRRLEAGLRKAPNPRTELNKKLKALDEKIDRIKFQFENDPEPNAKAEREAHRAEYLAKVQRANLEKQSARADLEKLPAVDIQEGQERLRTLAAAWDRATAAQQNHLLRQVVGKLEVDRLSEDRKDRKAPIAVVLVPTLAWSPFVRRFVHRDMKAGNVLAEFRRTGKGGSVA
jgi:site-specific DNA recombinase